VPVLAVALHIAASVIGDPFERAVEWFLGV
jgi:hypothetical protein